MFSHHCVSHALKTIGEESNERGFVFNRHVLVGVAIKDTLEKGSKDFFSCVETG